jgi:CubicO group peptidase (beta-lactamase class C family)
MFLYANSAHNASNDGASEATNPENSEAESPSDAARAIFAEVADAEDTFCSAAVRRGEQVVYAEAFGSDADGPIDTDTELDIASVSKQFTGVAIERLQAEGQLDGTDLVADLVPASAPGTEDVTIDELLTHTSGLADYTELLVQDEDEVTTQADAIQAISGSEPTGSRGRFEYSNSNYVLLAEVVQAVTGGSLGEYLETEVFGPLDLAMELDPRGAWKQVGDGSVWTSPTELVNWSGQYWKQTLDGPNLRRAMFDPEVGTGSGSEASAEWYGSGVIRSVTENGADMVFHDGSWDGYETDWVVLPDQQLAAAVTCDERATIAEEEPALALLQLWDPQG